MALSASIAAPSAADPAEEDPPPPGSAALDDAAAISQRLMILERSIPDGQMAATAEAYPKKLATSFGRALAHFWIAANNESCIPADQCCWPPAAAAEVSLVGVNGLGIPAAVNRSKASRAAHLCAAFNGLSSSAASSFPNISNTLSTSGEAIDALDDPAPPPPPTTIISCAVFPPAQPAANLDSASEATIDAATQKRDSFSALRNANSNNLPNTSANFIFCAGGGAALPPLFPPCPPTPTPGIVTLPPACPVSTRHVLALLC